MSHNLKEDIWLEILAAAKGDDSFREPSIPPSKPGAAATRKRARQNSDSDVSQELPPLPPRVLKDVKLPGKKYNRKRAVRSRLSNKIVQEADAIVAAKSDSDSEQASKRRKSFSKSLSPVINGTATLWPVRIGNQTVWAVANPDKFTGTVILYADSSDETSDVEAATVEAATVEAASVEVTTVEAASVEAATVEAASVEVTIDNAAKTNP